MLEEPILHFNTTIARQKPNSMHLNHACPFCEKDKLTGIIAVEDPIILLKNKYPVIQDSDPLLIIETDECETDLSEYSEEHLQNLMRFGLKTWLEMEKDDTYKSVIFYKNHGPLSGGTIRHPHMQIIGLKNVNYQDSLKSAYFDGETILEDASVCLNISTEPMIGFTEFNVILTDLEEDVSRFARYIQNTVKFLLHSYGKAISYNLFFYHWKDQVIAKIVPRFPTSPLFIGYRFRQLSNNVKGLVEQYKSFLSIEEF